MKEGRKSEPSRCEIN